MVQYDLAVGLMALAVIAMHLWRRDRRIRKWQRVINTRLSGYRLAEREDPEDELAMPYWERVLVPKWQSYQSAIAKRITPANFRTELEMKLRLAGMKQTPEGFFLSRVASSVAVFFLGVLGSLALPSLTQIERLLLPLVSAGAVFLFPGVHLNTKAQERMAEIDRNLPEVFDLLSVSVEAGLAFDGALRKVVSNVQGPVRDEFARVLADMQIGIPRAESLAALAKRTRSAPLRRFAGLVAQSDRTGSGIGAALKIQARDIKDYRAAKAREKAASIPIKIIFPMVLFIFPAIFIIILGPAIISVLKVFHV